MMISVADIQSMDRAALCTAWREIVGAAPLKGMSSVVMRRVLAFEIQARARGGLPVSFLKDLERAAKRKTPPRTGMPQPGARLMREWNGTVHVVDVVEDGVVWQGKRYRSLSVVAREITGTHWSGPRFFGVARAGG